jgi:hypothetical protein
MWIDGSGSAWSLPALSMDYRGIARLDRCPICDDPLSGINRFTRAIDELDGRNTP